MLLFSRNTSFVWRNCRQFWQILLLSALILKALPAVSGTLVQFQWVSSSSTTAAWLLDDSICNSDVRTATNAERKQHLGGSFNSLLDRFITWRNYLCFWRENGSCSEASASAASLFLPLLAWGGDAKVLVSGEKWKAPTRRPSSSVRQPNTCFTCDVRWNC